jgi:hypothetical protein
MMGKTMKPKRSEKGQTALEFMIIAPMLFGTIFLILGVALGWFTHATGSALALEGAAREAVAPGTGFALVNEATIPGQLQAGFTNSITNSYNGRTGKIFSVQGSYHLPLSPLGFNMDSDISSGALVPQWEFMP